ncbi:MAG: qrcB, partial [Deltaproteobacteria bacterium]|nr:qrcB [Deltaproteobacteria bacterium]
GRPGQRGKLVYIGPRLSITGIKADEWIPISPGTEGMLALGIAHMIVKEGLQNKSFVSNHTFGFDNWMDGSGKEYPGFKEILLSEYEASLVSKRTGVPIDVIIRLAREFASNQPSLAIGCRDRPFHQMAVSALNGLVGSIDSPGGVLIPKTIPFQPLSPVQRDLISRKGLAMERIDGISDMSMVAHLPYHFAKHVLSGKPYKPSVLFLYYTNPLFSNPNPDLFSRAFADIPLIVSFSPYLDDSTRYADLILPDHTPLERWQDDPLFLNDGSAVLGIRQPTVEPIHDTRATGDILISLAKSLGGDFQKAFPWGDFKELMIYGVRGIFETKRGDTFGLQFDAAWTRLLQRGGWAAPSYSSFDELWEKLQEKGGWWDPLYDFGERDRVFQTPSGKFEFVTRSVASPPPSVGSESSSLFPHWEEPKKGPDETVYPFHLHIFKTIALTGGRNANQPWLQSIFGPHLFGRWETWVEINPQTARGLGIIEGEWVWVESAAGKIKGKARLYPGTMPDVVNVPFGEGHRSGGRWANNLGENPYRLLEDDLDPLTGYPIMETTRVKLYKV